MFEYKYTIYNAPNDEIFQRQCRSLEKGVPNIVKGELLHDVDDSRLQFYTHGEHRSVVRNDYYLGAVHVESTEDLTQYFK